MPVALPPSRPAPPLFPWSAFLSDRGLDDDLLRHLVGTVYGAREILYAAMAMGVLITMAACVMTGAQAFLAFAGAHVIVGGVRLRLLPGFGVDCAPGCSRATIRSYDRAFTVWSTIYATLLGATFYDLLAMADSRVAMPLAVGGAVGFSVAFVTRSAGRLRLLALEVSAVLLPTIYGLLTLPLLHGVYFAILFVGVWITTLVMGRSSYARIVEHYRINETNRCMAQFDMLTGAHNRYAFSAALAEAVARASREPHARFALATVDMDRFKQINDTLGHEAGDKCLVEAATRLREAARAGDLVARLGGDEFVVLAFGEATDLCKLRGLGSRLAKTLSGTVEIDGAPVAMSASVGVAFYPEHAQSADELRRRSDIALYEAKRAGRGATAVFDAAMQSRLDYLRRLEIDFESALREDQFEAWFQPIQNIDTGSVVGYEALARWRHPQRGLILPDVFIPIAEQCGAIVPIGEAILRKACAAATGWDQRLTVAVNFSPCQFRDPQRLIERINTTLEETGLEPSRLFVEITESLMLEDTPTTRAAVGALSDRGVRFSLDDFGVGYSSMSYIQDYPFSKIKIDRKFIDRIGRDEVSTAIIASVCLLAARIKMDIVAEGVETKEQQQALKSLGIRQAQGYLYGRPLPQPVGASALKLVS